MQKIYYCVTIILILSMVFVLADNSTYPIAIANPEIPQSNSTCNLDMNITLWGMSLNGAFPFWQWKGIVFPEVNCGNVQNTKWLISWQEQNGEFSLMGMRAYFLIGIIFISIIIYLIVSIIKTDRLIDRYK